MQVEFISTEIELFPTKGSEEAAGLDLRAAETYSILNGSVMLVSTGVYAKIPKGYVGLLVARSSLHKQGLFLANSVGVIDSDYRGEIKAAIMCDVTDMVPMNSRTIQKGERIVQLVIVPHISAEPVLFTGTNEEWATARGTGGFGSTGVA